VALAGGQVTGSSALPAILTGTAVFVVVKMALFGGYLTGERPALLLLALAPMLAAYLLLRGESRAVLARDDAERTARREAELRAQEQEVARKLKETDQLKDDLLAMVSHELRTPLTTVVGALRLLSAGPPMGPAERREMLEMADRQARRLRVLIEQLLLAAQSDNGRATFLSSASERVEVDAALQILGNLVVTAGGARFELRLPLRPGSAAGPSAAEGRAAPLRVVPGPARRSG